jgi:hypothetical protein
MKNGSARKGRTNALICSSSDPTIIIVSWEGNHYLKSDVEYSQTNRPRKDARSKAIVNLAQDLWMAKKCNSRSKAVRDDLIRGILLEKERIYTRSGFFASFCPTKSSS